MTSKSDIEKLKEWLGQEIERLYKEGCSISKTKYAREAAFTKRYAYQDILNNVDKILLK